MAETSLPLSTHPESLPRTMNHDSIRLLSIEIWEVKKEPPLNTHQEASLISQNNELFW